MHDWTVKHGLNSDVDFKVSLSELVDKLRSFPRCPARSYIPTPWIVPSLFDSTTQAVEYFKDCDWVVLIDKDSNIWYKGKICTKEEVYGN